MLYENYHRKISKIAAILNVIRHYRVLILVVASIAAASTTGYLSVRGMVYDEVPCPTGIVYGETLPYQAKAVFGEVSYEYTSDASSDTWSDSAPTLPGTYSVRAVSTSSFGSPRYGDVYGYTILPKEVEVSVVEGRVVYGELPTVSAELEYEDQIVCDEFDYANLTLETTEVTPLEEAITVTNGRGTDVTYAYVLKPVSTEITFLDRAITVVVEGSAHVYDGQSFSFAGYRLDETTPVAWEDQLIATADASLTEVGRTQNKLTLQVVGEGNQLVTERYAISVVQGAELVVEQRPVDLITYGDEQVYDGTALSRSDFQVNEETPLVEGHRASLLGAPSLTEAGKIYNLLTVQILDEDGVDQTHNYAPVYSDDAFLTVHRRSLTVTTPSAERVYNAEPLSDDNYTVEDDPETADDSLAPDETHAWVETEPISITNRGSVTNTVTVLIRDAAGQDTTKNYAITYDYGTLTVTPIVLQMRSTGARRPYSGSAWGESGYEILNPEDVVAGQSDSYNAAASTQITDVLLGEDGEPVGVPNLVALTVRDGDNNDVSQNYVFDYGENHQNAGLLVVEPLSLTIETQSYTFIYDGQAKRYDAQGAGFTVTSGALADGQRPVAQNSASVTNVADSGLENTMDFVVVDANDRAVPMQNYRITVDSEGSALTVAPREVTVLSATEEWYYDGTDHANAGYTVTSQLGFADGQTVTVLSNTVRRQVTSDDPANNPGVPNELVLKVTDASGADVTETNYDITYETGRLTVKHRPLTITAGSAD